MVNKLKELRSTGTEEGFTLIELMIVVVIIGILAAIAIPIFANQQKSAIIAGVKSDVKNTNTNLVTALVKAPTANEITGDSVSNSLGNTWLGADSGTMGPTFAFVASDANTKIEASGSWNAYTIVGTNTSIKAAGPNATQVQAAGETAAPSNIAATNQFGIIYSSKNGKTVTVGG